MKESFTEELIRGEIEGFVREDSGNTLELDNLPIYDAPLVGFVSGTDPLFDRLKTVIGSFHRTPVEMMHDYAALNGRQPPNEDTVGVIAFILPMHAATVRENASMANGPSRRLIHGKYYGGAFRQKLTRHIIAFLTQRGYLATSPEDEPGLHQVTIDPRVGLTSSWSLRHVAYAAGLGTFGLSDGLITNAGIAQAIGSILVDSPFASPERPDDIHAACLYYQQNKCMACMKRCPAGAITEQGHDKERCRQFAFAQTALNEERYGIKTYGCGLCFSGVPCSRKNPASAPAGNNGLRMTPPKMLEENLRDEVVTVKTIEHLLLQNREHLKIHEHAFLESNQVIFSDEVRCLCERNACGMYGKSWACPPGVGSVADCKAQCSAFHRALIFTSLSPLRKKHDISGWQEARMRHETITENVVSIVRSRFDRILALSTEGCMVCESCTYPNQPCRFPERMFPAIEGFGINVMQLAKTCGIRYYNGPNTVTYFSIIFF